MSFQPQTKCVFGLMPEKPLNRSDESINALMLFLPTFSLRLHLAAQSELELTKN